MPLVSNSSKEPNGINSLLLVCFPHQLLHALSALRHERKSNGFSENAPATLIFWSYRSKHHASNSPIRALIKQGLACFPWVRIFIPSIQTRIIHLSPYRRLTSRINWFKKHLAETTVDTIYYSHDASADHTAQALMQAFPFAKRVCYGDPPGFLYPPLKEIGSSHFPRGKVKKIFWQSRIGSIDKWLQADKAIIAVNFSNQTGKKKDIELVPHALLLDTLYLIKTGIGRLSLQIPLQGNSPAPRFLLLLSNFSDSGLASRQDEIELYRTICATHVPLGEGIYIKPHVGTDEKFLARLIGRLTSWHVQVLPYSTRPLPVEFMPDLIAQCQVLSVSSSSVLLTHLFDKEISHVLTEELIRLHFKSQHAESFSLANQKIVEYLFSKKRKIKKINLPIYNGYGSSVATSKLPLKVLFIARDVGAAGQVCALMEEAQRCGIDGFAIAEDEASYYFLNRGISFQSANEWIAGRPEGKSQNKFVDFIAKRLKDFNVATVIFGRTSSKDANFEHCVLIAAKLINIPSVVIQDFWGDVGNFDYCPDHYFVIDKLAEQLTKQRTDSSVHVIGSPKHARFSELDFSNLRKQGRTNIFTQSDTKNIIGFFGQDLIHLEGYRQVLLDIGHIANDSQDSILVYKPHPRESKFSVNETLRILKSVCAIPIFVESTLVELLLASVDVVISCFSTVSLDAAYMMCNDGAPAVSIVCADYPAEVSSYWRFHTGLNEFPLVSLGVALSAQDKTSLRAAILTGLTLAERERQQTLCRAIFSSKNSPSEKTCALIRSIAEHRMYSTAAYDL